MFQMQFQSRLRLLYLELVYWVLARVEL